MSAKDEATERSPGLLAKCKESIQSLLIQIAQAGGDSQLGFYLSQRTMRDRKMLKKLPVAVPTLPFGDV
jgi:hypothetical protein